MRDLIDLLQNYQVGHRIKKWFSSLIGSYSLLLEDAYQSLVLQELMKRDEASLMYDAINPHQVFTIK
jgi:hypothetical protein